MIVLCDKCCRLIKIILVGLSDQEASYLDILVDILLR